MSRVYFIKMLRLTLISFADLQNVTDPSKASYEIDRVVRWVRTLRVPLHGIAIPGKSIKLNSVQVCIVYKRKIEHYLIPICEYIFSFFIGDVDAIMD